MFTKYINMCIMYFVSNTFLLYFSISNNFCYNWGIFSKIINYFIKYNCSFPNCNLQQVTQSLNWQNMQNWDKFLMTDHNVLYVTLQAVQYVPPRTEDRSVLVVIPWCNLTTYCALSVHMSLSADLSPCTGCYKLISLTLYSGSAAAVR